MVPSISVLRLWSSFSLCTTGAVVHSNALILKLSSRIQGGTFATRLEAGRFCRSMRSLKRPKRRRRPPRKRKRPKSGPRRPSQSQWSTGFGMLSVCFSCVTGHDEFYSAPGETRHRFTAWAHSVVAQLRRLNVKNERTKSSRNRSHRWGTLRGPDS